MKLKHQQLLHMASAPRKPHGDVIRSCTFEPNGYKLSQHVGPRTSYEGGQEQLGQERFLIWQYRLQAVREIWHKSGLTRLMPEGAGNKLLAILARTNDCGFCCCFWCVLSVCIMTMICNLATASDIPCPCQCVFWFNARHSQSVSQSVQIEAEILHGGG